jgi:hypothetical protein
LLFSADALDEDGNPSVTPHERIVSRLIAHDPALGPRLRLVVPDFVDPL